MDKTDRFTVLYFLWEVDACSVYPFRKVTELESVRPVGTRCAVNDAGLFFSDVT